MERIVSPAFRPARSAADCGATAEIEVGVRGSPYTEKKVAKMPIATRKLVSGPARTIRKRCQTAFDWKVLARSSAGSAIHSALGWLAGFMSPANLT